MAREPIRNVRRLRRPVAPARVRPSRSVKLPLRSRSSKPNPQSRTAPVPKEKSVGILQDGHVGEACFVIACGTSINSMDLSILGDHITIGVNRAIKSIDPTYWMFIDPPIINEFKEMGVDRLTTQKMTWGKWMGRKGIKSEEYLFFEQNRTRSIGITRKYAGLFFGGTTSYAAAHMAFIMGCNPIVLVGVDLALGKDGVCHFYDTKPELSKTGRRPLSGSRSIVKNSFAGKLMHTRKEFIKMRDNFRVAQKGMNEEGVELINASPWSSLDFLPYKPLEEIVKDLKDG